MNVVQGHVINFKRNEINLLTLKRSKTSQIFSLSEDNIVANDTVLLVFIA